MTHWRVLFVTQELDPLVPGGAGAVVSRLAGDLGEESSVILAAPGISATQGGGRLKCIELREEDGTVDWFVERSRLMAEAVSEHVAGGNRPELVEFADFEACAWWALTHRADLGLERTRIAVRLHGPVEAITDAIEASTPLLHVIGEMERRVYSMADVVLVPSAAVGRWAEQRYGIDSSRIIEAPPPVPSVEPRSWSPAKDPTFIHFGRLAEQKGVDDLMVAAGHVLDDHPGARFVLIGSDGWSLVHDRPMSEVLHDLISGDHADRIEFAGHLDRDEALDRLMHAWAVVLPSRYESFCLAAHEARGAGVPVVVPDLPVFDTFDEETGALKFDRSVEGLTATLQMVARDRGSVEALAGRPAPQVGDALEAYREPLPNPRHVNSQSALATAAVHHLEQLTEVEPVPAAATAQWLLRFVPRSLARLAARVLPRSLKDRFRGTASWWEEQARRDALARKKTIESRIAAGVFDGGDPHRVTVVIPCFNQGQWVDEAVLSVFEQTEGSWQVVLVDDGSTDLSTIKTLDELARWPRVRLIRQENMGLPAARNAGMTAAQGEFLVPLDADDELEPTYLEALIAVLEAQPAAAYAHCWGRYTGNLNAYWATRPFNRYQLLLSNSVLGCTLMRTEAWRAVGGYDESLVDGNEDWDLWLRFLQAGWNQVQVRQPLFRYRMHGPSMSVETLSEHEEARKALRDNHPGLYESEVAQATKARWYPWVTVIHRAGGTGLNDQDLADVEVVEVEANSESLIEAVRSTRGKVVVEWELLEEPPHEALRLLARALEDNPDAALAEVDGLPVAWRRWALCDPDAELAQSVEVDLRVKTDRGASLYAGIAPDPVWMVPQNLPEPGLRVIRQRPEEEGPLPGWLTG